MRKRFLFLSGILLVIAGYAYTQDLPTIKPPPPSAMQFQKYGDYPVSHFTGIPDISIPLYTIKEGDLEVPITLSYHASGYRPTDVDGIVGYGWVLNVGGQITRTVYDLEDEKTHLLFSNNQPRPTANYVNGLLSSPFSQLVDTYLGEIESKFQYDIFSYDFQGKHGKFIMKDYDINQCTLLDYQPISLTGVVSSEQIMSFTAKDETGITHVFGQRNGSLGTNTSDFWSLSSIQSAIDASNIITYSYTSGPTTTYRSRVDTYTKDDNESDPSTGGCSSHPEPYDIYELMPYWSDEISTAHIENGSDGVVPSQINFRSGRVQFVYDPVTKMISAMDVYNKNNELLKRIRFDLFKNNSLGRNYYFLNKVKLYDRYDNFINEYVFKHNLEYVSVPEYNAPVDYWGYLNENGYSEGDLIPRFFIEFQDWYGNNPSKVVGTSYRQSSESHMKSFQLNEIIYPTGGKTVFEFEANQYYGWDGPMPPGYAQTAVGGLRIKRILNYSDTNTLSSVKDYEYLESRMDIIPSRPYYTRSSVRYIITHAMGGILSSYRRTEVSSDPLVNLAPHGSPVVYPNVNERIRKVLPDGTIDMDPATTQTINYSYDWQPFNPYSFPNTNGNEGEGSFPLYAPYLSIVKAYTDGKLLNVSYSGPTSNSTSYEYEEIPLTELQTFYSGRYAFYQAHPCVTNMDDPDYWFYQSNWGTQCHLNYGDVTIKPVNKRLKSTTETKQGVATYTEFHYDNNTHNQPTSKTVTTSNGETFKTTYQYPHEKQSGGIPNVYNAMVARHIWSPVIEQATYKAATPDLFLQSTNTNYDYWENNTWSSGTANSLIVPRTVQTKVGTDNPETRIRFSAYDDKANVLSVAKENNIKMAYVWGYNQSYPIAEVFNAEAKDVFHTSFEELSSGFTWDAVTGRKSIIFGFTQTLTNLTDGSYTLSYWQKSGSNWAFASTPVTVTGNTYTINISGQVDEVRFYPAAAFMTTFTFDPLIGKTSETNSNNRTEYYEYDPALRLMHILDEDKNVLKKFSYSFYNSSTASVTAPNWQNTGNGYCETCKINPAFNNGYRIDEQIDNNPNSYTSGQKRWNRELNISCGTVNDYWQNTDNYYCVKNGLVNTGELMRQQVFINPCYDKYQQTQWVSQGTNTNACPVPTVFYSEDLSGDYTKGNCGADYAGSQVYVSVPAAMFSSPTSLAEANAQAYAYAQDVADSDPSGVCTPIPFMLQCENQTDDNIEVSLYDPVTGNSYSFIVDDDTYYHDLGYILPGTYEVTFLNLDYPIGYYYYLNCGSIYAEGYNVTVPNVTIGSGCNQIQILD